MTFAILSKEMEDYAPDNWREFFVERVLTKAGAGANITERPRLGVAKAGDGGRKRQELARKKRQNSS